MTLFHIGETPISGATVITVLLILFASSVISRLVQRGMKRVFQFKGVDHEGTARATSRLVHYGVVLTGLGVALQTAGINLSALFAAGAIFAVGLGFAMQSIAQNFVSGVILLIERSIKPGDIIEISQGMVRVEKMGIRATIVQTRDGETLIVPNSSLIQSTVKNYTYDKKSVRVRISVGVVYSANMQTVFETLKHVARVCAEGWKTGDMEQSVVMTGFGDNSVNFDVAVWTHDPWRYRQAISDLHDAVWWALKEQDVAIAFPQLDVHLDDQVIEALKGLTPHPSPAPAKNNN